ncbi:hypothetical protein OH77DRAFT_1399680, partial [Trametes cingulata]
IPLITPYLPRYSDETEDSLRALVSGDVSAVFGGSTPYLRADEEWPRCKQCQHTLIPYIQISLSSGKTPQAFRERIPPLQTDGATLFQLFICAAESDLGDSCFEHWVVQYSDEHVNDSWLIRRIHVDGGDAGLASPEAEHEASNAARRGPAPPERVILEWTAGTPETAHLEEDSGDFDDEYYAAHEPAQGLKLLGYPERGKFYCTSTDSGECTAGDAGPHCDWRCLIQLGTQDEDNSVCRRFYTIGNMYVDQCSLHPEVFQAVSSGTW